jgi:hypothetical protein
MPEQATTSPAGVVPSADDLRMTVLTREMELMKQREDAKSAAQKKLAELADEFMTQHVSDKEREMIRRIVLNAVSEGKLEALVYSFPSRLCTDGGRAINNGEPDWPETLQGKAKELYDRYTAAVKPKGYKLKAMIINFPDGVPGDVGLFLNWEPENY